MRATLTLVLVLAGACGTPARAPAGEPAPSEPPATEVRAEPVASQPAGYVGLRFRDGMTELPPSLEWRGESLIGPSEPDPDHQMAVTWAREGDETVLLLEREVVAPGALWEVVGLARLPARPERWSILSLDCELDGVRDPWIVAAVGLDAPCRTPARPAHAFRGGPVGTELVPVPPARVRCPRVCEEESLEDRLSVPMQRVGPE
jgi:hypothetical protein